MQFIVGYTMCNSTKVAQKSKHGCVVSSLGTRSIQARKIEQGRPVMVGVNVSLMHFIRSKNHQMLNLSVPQTLQSQESLSLSLSC